MKALTKLGKRDTRLINEDDAPPSGRLLIHILIEKDADSNLYSALCLDFDIASQGRTPHEAERRLMEAVESFLDMATESGQLHLLRRKAPKEEWDKFNARKIAEFERSPRKAKPMIIGDYAYSIT